jgi:formamidopyrimidine-DNA glycosylase
VEFAARASLVFRRAFSRSSGYFCVMPELAEVEFYRRRWDAGLGAKITRAHLNAQKRVARGIDAAAFERALAGAKFLWSEGHGKRMLFRFSDDIWLGIHLGMTGALSVEAATFAPGKHDHLVLFQKQRALVFHDPRQFGRIQFHQGKKAPAWWRELPPQPHEAGFSRRFVEEFFGRRKKVPIKAALLMQEAFAGVGNWMADEILWRARVNPRRRVETLAPREVGEIWKQTRWVSRESIKRIAPAHADPPKGWLFNERWGKRGVCPRDGTPLQRAEVGGRTTAWCPKCQP